MISIVIPTYNEEEYLPQLLDSINRQDFREFEIIVADNSSTDRTREIARKHGCILVKGGLPSAARNNGAAVARGDYIFFMDADIVLEPRFLSNAMRELQQHRLEVAGVNMVSDSQNIVDQMYYRLLNLWFWLTQKLFPHCVGSCMITTPIAHERINGFDTDITLAEDNDYVRRASKRFRFGIIRGSVCVSARRFEKEGRLRMGMKYLLVFFYRLFIGEIKSDIFRYRFGHYQ